MKTQNVPIVPEPPDKSPETLPSWPLDRGVKSFSRKARFTYKKLVSRATIRTRQLGLPLSERLEVLHVNARWYFWITRYKANYENYKKEIELPELVRLRSAQGCYSIFHLWCRFETEDQVPLLMENEVRLSGLRRSLAVFLVWHQSSAK